MARPPRSILHSDDRLVICRDGAAMVVGVKKYNPGFLTDDEIVASFCVRTGEFEAVLECLQASTGQSNAHALVVGPRGSGKTHLLLRVAAEVRRDVSLVGFYPVVFAEESYEIATIGEFWLECVGRLAEQAPCAERADLRLSYNDLRNTRDDRDLADRCMGTVLDFADRHGKRVVLLVENLNMLFGDMDDPDAGWRLRHTLQTEPRHRPAGQCHQPVRRNGSPRPCVVRPVQGDYATSSGYPGMRVLVGNRDRTTLHNPVGQTSGDPDWRKSQTADDCRPIRRWSFVSRSDGQSAGFSGRSHRVL